MKKVLFLLLAALFSLPAFAGASATAASGSVSGATSTASTGSSTAQQQNSVGVSNTLNFPAPPPTTNANVNYGGDYTVRSAPTVYAPSLTNSLSETCLGSASGGVSGPGFGVTLGKTTTDEGCERRLNAAIMAKLGMTDISFRIMCESKQVFDASKGSAHPCPGAVVGKVKDPQYTDPIIRERLGLPPLPAEQK